MDKLYKILGVLGWAWGLIFLVLVLWKTWRRPDEASKQKVVARHDQQS